MKRRHFIAGGMAFGLTKNCLLSMTTAFADASEEQVKLFSVEKQGYVYLQPVIKTKAEWKALLSPKAFKILRLKGTERPHTSAYNQNKETGLYRCAGCGTDLFDSKHKFESGTGWPSFTQPVAPENIKEREDSSFFMQRIEVLCSRCNGHLGHVFDDGPQPTGLRYCINGVALDFKTTDA